MAKSRYVILSGIISDKPAILANASGIDEARRKAFAFVGPKNSVCVYRLTDEGLMMKGTVHIWKGRIMWNDGRKDHPLTGDGKLMG